MTLSGVFFDQRHDSAITIQETRKISSFDFGEWLSHGVNLQKLIAMRELEGLHRFELVYYLKVSLEERRLRFLHPQDAMSRHRGVQLSQYPALYEQVEINCDSMLSHGVDYIIILSRAVATGPSLDLDVTRVGVLPHYAE